MLRPTLAVLLLALAPVAAPAGSLTLFASGEDLATEGFQPPRLTRDGWQLTFSRILVRLDSVTAWRTDPPFAADRDRIEGTALAFGGPFTVDLVDADAEHRVELATQQAEPGHYNALSWSLAPAADGTGHALLLEGVARRDGAEVAFTLVTHDAIAHACGEYVGDMRKGILAEGSAADLEITLHLDHLFGRADRDADDPMNLQAPGFDPFAGGGMQEFSLAGLHLGHVGEGHCHDSPL